MKENFSLSEAFNAPLSENDIQNKGLEIQPSSTKYESRAVLFLDILGFKELINKSESNLDLISKLADLLGSSKKFHINKFFDAFQIEYDLKNIDYRLATFSDFFAMSVPCNKDNISISRDEAIHIASLIYAAFTQFRILIINGFLSRGGIALGNIYHIDSTDNRSNNILFGKAFNEAYLLESKFANTPRIIISNHLRKIIKSYCEESRNQDCKIKSFFDKYVSRAADGPAYINVFADFTHPPFASKEDIIKIRDNLQALLNEETDKPKIYEKILAISRLFNDAINVSPRLKEKVELKIKDEVVNLINQ